MNNKFDELTKSLARSVTRRGALKKFWGRPREHGAGGRVLEAANLPGPHAIPAMIAATRCAFLSLAANTVTRNTPATSKKTEQSEQYEPQIR
jgi:hypothetical protein